ncbi:MAG TPA: hypothetical protein PKX00_11235 [Opitutaceae bacterium]|nr:hypothetical protein [Opitutaceae bacterium]HRE06175.1 hypothetical protein [Opitutaceae bacterium]
MSKHTPICARILASRHVLAFSACMLTSVTLSVSVGADGAATARADKPATALATAPWKASFKKEASGKNEAPMVLLLKNESKQALTVSGTITLSVVVHNRPKTRDLPSQTVAAGAVLTIDNLAPDDKVTLNTTGFAPWSVVVPYKP